MPILLLVFTLIASNILFCSAAIAQAKDTAESITHDTASNEATHEATSETTHETENKKKSFLAPKIDLNFPTFLGGGADFAVSSNIHLALLYGFVPEPFYNTIASVGADIGDEPAYEGLINAAFEDNQIIKADLLYTLPTASRKWSIGISYYYIQTEGRAEIDEVLSAITGKDYTNLKNLLIAAGRDTKVDLTNQAQALEIMGTYSIHKSINWSSQLKLGVAKILNVKSEVETGLPNFEASQAGQKFLRETESDLEEIVIDNGLTPTIGIDLVYNF